MTMMNTVDTVKILQSEYFSNWLAESIVDNVLTNQNADNDRMANVPDNEKPTNSQGEREAIKEVLRQAENLQVCIDAAAQVYKTQEKHLARLPFWQTDVGKNEPNRDSGHMVAVSIQLQQAQKAEKKNLPKLLSRLFVKLTKLAQICATRVASCDCTKLSSIASISTHLRDSIVASALLAERLDIKAVNKMLSHAVLQAAVLSRNINTITSEFFRLQSVYLASLTKKNSRDINAPSPQRLKSLVPDMKAKGFLLPLDLKEQRRKIQPENLQNLKVPPQRVVKMKQLKPVNDADKFEKWLCTLDGLTKLWSKSLQDAQCQRNRPTKMHRTTNNEKLQTKEQPKTSSSFRNDIQDHFESSKVKPANSDVLQKCLDEAVSSALNDVDLLCDKIVEKCVQEEFA